MQKVIFYLAVMLSVCMFSSCSSDDDSALLNEKEITLNAKGTQQLQAMGNVSKWSSENDFVASVSESGMVTANHVGETTIIAQGDGGSTSCHVIVKPQYNYYVEPLCQEGATREDVKKYEKRNLHSEDSKYLFYEGENSLVSAVAYQFDEKGKLISSFIILPHHNSTTLLTQLVNFLVERYVPATSVKGAYVFMDAYKLKLVNKIMYMVVDQPGYEGYIAISYTVNTNK